MRRTHHETIKEFWLTFSLQWHGEQHAESGEKLHVEKKKRLLTQNFDGDDNKKPRQTCWSNKSPRCVSFEVVRKCSGEISNNSRLSQLRRGKQQRFQPSSCPKNCYSCGVLFGSPRSPLGLSEDLTRARMSIWGSSRGVWSGFFSKKCEKCQRFSLLCQSHRLQQWVFKVSTLLQQRPESAIYLCGGTRRPNVTSRRGIKE